MTAATTTTAAATTEQISSLAFRNFSQTCRSSQTRAIYAKILHYFMDYLRLASNDYDKLLERDSKIIQTDICDFVTFLRQNKISYATISLYVAAIKKFYDMNDTGNMTNWRRVRHFMGEHEKEFQCQKEPTGMI